jgi:hypothetical protein
MTPDSLQRLIDHHRDVAQIHQRSYDWVAAKFAASKYAAPPGIVDDAVTAKFRFTLWADKRTLGMQLRPNMTWRWRQYTERLQRRWRRRKANFELRWRPC